MKICRVATVPFFVLHHLGSQIAATVAAGHEVHVVTSQGQGAEQVAALPRVTFHPIRISRPIAPLQDGIALVRLYRYFTRERFTIMHSTTPKAGLLCAVAAWLAQVPVRLHTFTGQAWVERRGLVRWISIAADRLIVRLNTCCYADSPSQRDFLLGRGIGSRQKLKVLGHGSLAGVELHRFRRETLAAAAADLRERLGMPASAQVIAFIGRVHRDKGIAELVTAFRGLAERFPKVWLVLVGPFETEGAPLPAAVEHDLQHHPRIRAVGYDPAPEAYLALAELLCLPSYREGFANVVVEAGAMGVPTVGTRIVGLVDSVADGETGILVPTKDPIALQAALTRLLADDALRRRMGQAAQARAEALFDSHAVNRALLEEYQALLEDQS